MATSSKTTRKRSGQDVFAGRRRAVASRLSAAKADALLVTKAVDVGYLTGFTGEDSNLVLGPGWACLVTDGRFTEQVERECPGLECHVRSGAMESAVAGVLRGRGVRRLGFEPRHATVKFAQDLAGKLGSKRLVEVGEAVSRPRQLKDDTELRTIRRAIRIAEDAFRELCALGAGAWIGRTERDLAAELEYRMRLGGAEAPSFETILAAGAHGSLPHYRPSGQVRIKPNQAVLVDWGARVDGYCSDLTRVVFTGTIPPQLREIYEVVRRAQEAGIAAIRGGVGCKAVDKAAREVIVKAGFGERFAHGLGHGLGREVHEAPGLGRLSTTRLRSGMVVTVEPGIYLPGIGGVRIEDDVLVTPTGARRLSSLPRDIEAMKL